MIVAAVGDLFIKVAIIAAVLPVTRTGLVVALSAIAATAESTRTVFPVGSRPAVAFI